MSSDVAAGDSGPVAHSRNFVFFVVALFPLAFIVAALLIETPAEIFGGLLRILTSRDTLISDYMGIGGIGAAFMNAGLLTLAKPWHAEDPSAVLAAPFGTTLAPLAGRFGWHWGIAAGFLHSSVVQSVVHLHGGLVLYNNGFAAGLVATILVPVILALQRPVK